jgi:phosphocarrier protein HPr
MIRKKITICNKLGLHARASMKLVNLAERFQSEILLIHKNREVNAKSIMSLMVIGAPCGTTIELTAEGADETKAMTAVAELITNKFGENE